MDIPKYLEIIGDKDTLSNQLQFVALFIAMYEKVVDFVEENVKFFLCHICIESGKLEFVETKKYKDEIKNKAVDDKGNKNKTKASFLFLVDCGIISSDDYSLFEELHVKRNKYVHEMFSVILEDIEKEEIELFFKMLNLYDKITKNWFIEIEAPIAGIVLTDKMKEESVCFDTGLFDLIIQSLFGDSEKIKDIIENAKRESNI